MTPRQGLLHLFRAQGWIQPLAVLCLCASAAGAAPPALAQEAVQPPAAARQAGPPLPGRVRQLLDWTLTTGDHQGLPFAIVDKRGSEVFVFDKAGQLSGRSPALVGAARGDDPIPGIGSRAIASIRPQERVTPAGRFEAVMGQGPEGEDLLWVDYDQALALHRVVNHVKAERRLERLRSPRAADRRITYGCINVPVAFFDEVVRPGFTGTPGIVYILPESGTAAALLRPAGDVQGRRHAAAGVPPSP